MSIDWITPRAPTASCLSAEGSARSIAAKFAIAHRAPDDALVQRARVLQHHADVAGRVQSMGQWQDAAVYAQLGESLGHVSTALRSGFEWYQCRGAFFHNDAHYDARMFGVWYIAGPAAELVFPRAAARSPISTGSIVVFDPFEVHGVLAPGCVAYSAADYENAEPSVFVGFELELTRDVSAAFGIDATVGGVIISSKTRVCPISGTLISD
jgi:hypothetical protein